MRRILIQKANVYDMINDTNWPEELLRMVTPLIAKNTGLNFVFDEADKCVYCLCE